MKPLGKISVPTVIPARLERLADISYNLWWSWNCEAAAMFRSIDPELWEKTGRNPVALMRSVGNTKLGLLLEDREFIDKYDSVVKQFDSYMNSGDTWFNREYPGFAGRSIAYFSAEYGLSETLPIYSGGLGVLSGDHCKSASDLGLPFTAVGLFYRQGYFSQTISSEGIQETSYNTLNIEELPVRRVNDKNGEPLLINVDMPGRTVYAAVWKVRAGRVDLYLLDSDVPGNSEQDRNITARLYGGGGDTRIQQEILLGIGGIRALKALGINPSAYHMNEGHSAFLGFELIKEKMLVCNIGFKEALELVSASSVFTIHTPVPAGIDVFNQSSIDTYFTAFRESFGISREDFMALGRDPGNPEGFNMASLAMTIASGRNGVSKLHGSVTRNMFSRLWPDIPVNEVPITHVTNGIHTLSWLSGIYKQLFDKYFINGWENRIGEPKIWNDVKNIPDEEFWSAHKRLKESTASYVNSRIRVGHNSGGSMKPCRTIDPAALTIGFSRRFATYKRAALIFRDIDRIRKILNMPDMPVQIIFAGKAHPDDRPAQDVIRYINDVSEQEGFEGKVVLLENYNIALARRLVQSVDVWLNNPRMPLEASGTSGQKAGLNGVLNLSVLDGWWREGYNGSNGWAIGTDEIYSNEFCQDNADSESLYDLLENSLIPLYYDRNDKGIPSGWVKMMKESVSSLAAQYSTHRMVREYADRLYIPAINQACSVLSGTDGSYTPLRELVSWKDKVYGCWAGVSVSNGLATDKQPCGGGERVTFEISAVLSGLKPEDVSTEIYYGPLDCSGSITDGRSSAMQAVEETAPGIYRYRGDLCLAGGDEYGYHFRIVPSHPLLKDKFELRLVKWAET
ncbi:MAG TPA: alpha-glucan family phosphorylase [Clostridia bacterium]|nr:alpha-glucan family phosphorylase [Clostridia bacterium]